MNEKIFELIVRGVCLCNGMLLLCRNRKVGNVFLPGGHIELGESADHALKRELREELAMEGSSTQFLGVAENRFVQAGVEIFELNLVFSVHIDCGGVCTSPQSVESHIEFFWCLLSEVPVSGMLPTSLAERLQGWVEGSDPVRFIPMHPCARPQPANATAKTVLG